MEENFSYPVIYTYFTYTFGTVIAMVINAYIYVRAGCPAESEAILSVR